MPDTGLATLDRRDRISPEYLGKARLLVKRFQEHDGDMYYGINAAFGPIRQRYLSGHVAQRLEDLVALVKVFEEHPLGLLLRTKEFNRSRRTLDLWELRVCSGTFSKARWLNPTVEPALLVCAITVQITKGKGGVAALHVDVMAAVSMHCLARWLQRSFDTDDATLMNDMREIALHYGDIIQQCDQKPHRYKFETPNGFWCGEALRHDGRITLAVDTFLPHDTETVVTWTA